MRSPSLVPSRTQRPGVLISPRRMIFAGLVTVIALALSAIIAGPASARIHWIHCGKKPSLRVEILTSKVSCRKAIRIVAAYQQSGFGVAPKKVPGFPGWECSNGDRLGTCSRGNYAQGAPLIDFPFLEAPGERRLGAPAGLDRGAGPMADRSCGSVVVQRVLTYKLTVEKGSPSCGTVRRIAKKYGHPISKKPRFYCGQKAYECEYSLYPEGWRCGGLFQGTFECWHGANSPLRADEAFHGTEDMSARLLMRKPRDAFEFYAKALTPTTRLSARSTTATQICRKPSAPAFRRAKEKRACRRTAASCSAGHPKARPPLSAWSATSARARRPWAMDDV